MSNYIDARPFLPLNQGPCSTVDSVTSYDKRGEWVDEVVPIFSTIFASMFFTSFEVEWAFRCYC
ncbi:hypothetical protein BU16DRAFT_531653 [Lophium mytilinum]|uniref:Uncharacterized protein n=1 Tax=Lophium mytilinum TaxID=390894 RepID=A0A6A6QB72_9PEZI|nr:hypothetical protein BU16DRAFT_531653 [Lophium mytilinum]